MQLKRFGTEVDVNVHMLGNHKAKVDLHLRESNIDNAHAVRVDGVGYPGFAVTEIKTSCEAGMNEPLLLGGLMVKKTMMLKTEAGDKLQHDDVELLLVISLEAAESMEPAAAIHPVEVTRTSFGQAYER